MSMQIDKTQMKIDDSIKFIFPEHFNEFLLSWND